MTFHVKSKNQVYIKKKKSDKELCNKKKAAFDC